LLYHFPVSEVGKQRLSLMRETTDGFLLSEEDLKLRGAGDILGKEQSGFDTLRFSDFSDNYALVQIADEIAQKTAPNDVLYKIFKRQNDDVIA
jgi:ATP-dependent DNA helicase RecG